MEQVVLVAERDQAALSQLSNAIRGSGFAVIEAKDWAQALRLYGERNPDLVLLGEGMEEALEKIPESVVVMVISPESLPIVCQRGINDFILKPVDWDAFGYRILHAMRNNGIIRRLESVLEAIPDRLFLVEKNGNCRQMSGQFSEKNLIPPVFGKAGIAMGTGKVQETEFELQEEDGLRHFEARTIPLGNEEAIVLIRDITERKQAEERMRHVAYFDNLTGLPNRQAFLINLEAELKRSERGKLAVFMLDIDSFTRINELLGRDVGDHLLEGMAERLSNCFSEEEKVSIARYGGDEFAVLFSGIGRVENAFSLAKRIKDAVGHPFVVDLRQIVVTCAIGISICPEDSRDAASLLKYAEFAKQRARDSGKDRIQLYSSSLTNQMLYRRDLESSLRKALERKEFMLHFQPRVEISNSKVVGAEALIRWRRSEHILVPPSEFIPLAEETGLILPMGEWVLRTACLQAAAWREAGSEMSVSVNLSPHQLRDGHFKMKVLSILEETGLDPNLLELEISEDALMNLGDSSPLHDLAEKGLRFAIDRFGAGYTSMSRLKRFHLNTLKIAREFITGLETSPEDAAMIRAIIAMAQSLSMEVVAMGVETVGQAERLNDYGCAQAQGFLYDRVFSD